MVDHCPSLIVVGSGIKFISHLTIEAKIHIEQASKVLYLINEPAMKNWIKKANKNAESLDFLYIKYSLRKSSYQAITDYILESLNINHNLCVVLYGHPTVFAQPALNAVIKAKQNGYFAKILPGISAEDCLFADLLIDPGKNGCLSLEATDLLINKRYIDTSCHLILWQISVIGVLHHAKVHDNTKGTKLLFKYLNQYYNSNHQTIIYSAAQYPGFEPVIRKLHLKEIVENSFPRASILYLPPAHTSCCDKETLSQLGINFTDI